MFYFCLASEQALRQWEQNTRPGKRLGDFEIIFEHGCASSTRRNGLRVSWSGTGRIIPKESIRTYFNLICRDGLITAEIGEYLGLRKENIFGGDVNDPQNERITFVPTNVEQSTIHLGND